MDEHEQKEKMKKIFREGFLNYTGFTHNEIDMKKLEQAPHRRKRLRKVTRADRENLPMPEDRIQLEYARRFTAQEQRKLSYGLLPADHDEKWHIFLEDDWLCLHRSWTGECSYLLKLAKHKDEFRVVEAWMNPVLDFQEKGYAQKFLDYLIDRLLLSKPVPFPFPKHIQAPLERALFRHAMVGSSVANDQD